MNEFHDEDVTEALVAFAKDLSVAAMPAAVRHHCIRSIVDSVGCIVGGSTHPVVSRATDSLSEFFGPGQASLIGQGRQADVLNAAMINGLAGAAYSYFDSYSEAHLHAGVVHAAALLGLSERVQPSGADFVNAYAAGLEVACRLTKAIALPPADADIGWSIGGIVCGVSSAVAAGRLLGLSSEQLTWALGIAASGAAGTRAEHGTMTAGLIFGQAAQTGVRAAILASSGFTSSNHSLTGNHGYARMFSRAAHLPALVEGLNERFELSSTTFKPFPTDIAIHPGIDAMLQLKAEHQFSHLEIAQIEATVSDLAGTFCDRPAPANELEAKFSLQHWVAAAAVYGEARLQQGRSEVVHDPEIRQLGMAMGVEVDPAFSWDEMRMTVVMRNGTTLEKSIDHCVGSIEAPMPDADISTKFVAQSEMAIGDNRAAELVQMCWAIADLPDASALAICAR